MCFPGIIRGRRVGAGGWAFRESRIPIGQAEPMRQTVSSAAALDFLPRRTPVSAGRHRKRKMEGPSALGGMRLSTRSPASPPHASGFGRTVPGPPPSCACVCFQAREGFARKSNRGLVPALPSSCIIPAKAGIPLLRRRSSRSGTTAFAGVMGMLGWRGCGAFDRLRLSGCRGAGLWLRLSGRCG
jgi:hypothetical protein